MDLDQVIKDSQNCVKVLGKIDIKDKYKPFSIDRLMVDIKSEALKLNENIPYIDYVQPVTIELNENVIRNHKIRLLDVKLMNFILYRRCRNIARKIYRQFIPEKSIKAKHLLQYEDEQFVRVLYRTLLGREVDHEALYNCCNQIKYDHGDKIELIIALMNSQEGKGRGIKVTGIKARYLLRKTKKIILSIPLFGYLIKITFGIIMLPKRIRSLQKSIVDIAIHNKQIEASLFNMEIRNDDKIKLISSNIEKSFLNKISETNKNIGYLLEIEEKRKQLEEADNEKKILEEQYHKKILDYFYLRYNEELMKDSREIVMERAKTYLSHIDKFIKKDRKENLVMIDLGCGEGEFIELLNKEGYPIYGVDSNSAVVSKMKKSNLNLNIIEENAMDHLKKLGDNSVDYISAFHMVEHLEFLELILLLKECKRVLKIDGLLILETPNPQNILISSYYFNLDPTHKKPIPPELLKFYVEESGFTVKDLMLLRPLDFCDYDYNNGLLKDIVFRFNMEQAYSIVAVKEL